MERRGEDPGEEIWVSLLWDQEAKQAAICPSAEGETAWRMRLRGNFYEVAARSFTRHIGVTDHRRFAAHVIDQGGGSIMFDVGEDGCPVATGAGPG